MSRAAGRSLANAMTRARIIGQYRRPPDARSIVDPVAAGGQGALASTVAPLMSSCWVNRRRSPGAGASLSECVQQLSCVASILGADDRIVSVTHDHNLAARMPLTPLAYPGIEDVVQKDIGQERAARTLGTSP